MHNVFYRTKRLLPGPSVPTKYQRRPTQPHDIAKMDLRPPKLKLSLDVAETNAERDAEVAAEKQNKSDRYPKNHTTYVDLVSQLRNPTAAETMETWMTTGRKVSLPIGARRPKPKMAQPRRRKFEVTAEEYEQAFDEDMSGSLSGSMAAHQSQVEESEPKVTPIEEEVKDPPEDKGSLVSPEQGVSNAAPQSYLKAVIERYKHPKEIYKTDRSNEEYLEVFEQWKNETE